MIKILSQLLGRKSNGSVPTKSETGTETITGSGHRRNVDIAHQFLALPDRARWSADDWQLLRHRDAFLSVDWGLEPEEIVAQWNHLFDPEHSMSLSPSVETLTDRFSYKGQTGDFSYRPAKEDCFIALLAMAQLANADIETRFCTDSIGNSDLCFLPLFHAEWSQLEKTHGTTVLAQRFAKLPADIDDFLTLLN